MRSKTTSLSIVLSVTILALTALPSVQECNSTDFGNIPQGATGSGAGPTRDDALSAATLDLTDAPPCDVESCDETGCAQEINGNTGTGGSATCFPIFVPLGHPPIWVCQLVAGSGASYTSDCAPCD